MFQCTFFSLFYYCCWKYRKEQNMLPCQRGPPLNPKDYTYTNLTPLVFTMFDFEVHGYLEHTIDFLEYFEVRRVCAETHVHIITIQFNAIFHSYLNSIFQMKIL